MAKDYYPRLTGKQVQKLRDIYKKGTKVKLIQMDDPHAPPRGTQGTVSYVDDMGHIHVNWDTGSGLSVIPGVDKIETI